MRRPRSVKELFALQRKLQRRAVFFFKLHSLFGWKWALNKCHACWKAIRDVEAEYISDTFDRLNNK